MFRLRKSIERKKNWLFEKYIYDRSSRTSSYEIPLLRKEKMTSDDLFSPVQDRIFKIMFQNKDNKLFTCYLLSLIFDIDLPPFYDRIEPLNVYP